MAAYMCKALLSVALVVSLSGCPSCAILPALLGSWTWTSDEFLPTTYVLELEPNGAYGMAEFFCGGSCDSIEITNELGLWEACYSLSESRGQLHTRAENDNPKNFHYEWDAQTSYRIIDDNTLLLDMVDPDGMRIETLWSRSE